MENWRAVFRADAAGGGGAFLVDRLRDSTRSGRRFLAENARRGRADVFRRAVGCGAGRRVLLPRAAPAVAHGVAAEPVGGIDRDLAVVRLRAPLVSRFSELALRAAGDSSRCFLRLGVPPGEQHPRFHGDPCPDRHYRPRIPVLATQAVGLNRASMKLEPVPLRRSNMPGNEMLEKLSESLGSKATVKAVFGEPIQAAGKTIIPVAKVAYGFGGGFGTGPVKDGNPKGEGGGAGGSVRAFPAG